MVRDDKGKGKEIMKDKKKKLTRIKEVDELEQRIKNTEEEDPLPINVYRQTEEEDTLLLDIVYPLPEIALSSRDINIRGQAHYGLRSLGPIQEEVVVVKKPYSLVKVTNAVLGLRAPIAEVECSGSGRKRVLNFLLKIHLLLGYEGVSSREAKLTQIFTKIEQPVEEEVWGLDPRDVGTENQKGPTEPALQTQATPSPSPAFIKENIDVLRTMIKEHDPLELMLLKTSKEYMLKDYYCWLKTYCCWCKLMLLDDAADIKLRMLEQSAAVGSPKLQSLLPLSGACKNIKREKPCFIKFRYNKCTCTDLNMKLEKKKLASMEKIMNKLRIAQVKAQEMRQGISASEAPRKSSKIMSLRRYPKIALTCFRPDHF
nr:hypothetical protein [Tanacetum cinerariifolium]